ncbi:glucosidase 2 subunit beta like protein [Danaus plexippus plexippus]|uniref:Glucosidase 2 subunit beta like protein n=1 Tax=Danaus plexippus plexippus TaxID=278856 RepID=A0A212EQB5_DANPL|nr:glucosidase 2 subunit beta like protein [Danaus plexippus plexippus]
MGLKKKKNVIILTSCIASCFILYQLYFFLTISSADIGHKVVPVLDYDRVKNYVQTRTKRDKYINIHGIIRGVYFRNVKEYRPDSNNEFSCLTSHQKIPIEQLNDDFCDCEDGSDEPSTTACPNGIFYCDTQFSKGSDVFSIPSNKVNDGICDCCDGSDEFEYPDGTKLLSQNINNRRFYVDKCISRCFRT